MGCSRLVSCPVVRMVPFLGDALLPRGTFPASARKWLQIRRVLPVAPGDDRIRAEERMLRHVRRVTRCRGRLARCLGPSPDMMRGSAAADTEGEHPVIQ